MELISYKNTSYPKFQTEGFSSQYIFPFAKKYCIGVGYDIGCNRVEWSLDGSIPVDIALDNNNYDAFNLPNDKVDYIFSSHCLEHLDSWVDALLYWETKIKSGGILFLYLPHFSQEYWRPWNNRKHKHCMDELQISSLLQRSFTNIFVSGVDLNNSFTIVAEKL
jgi:predicted SAM-dependent methyltransferase